MSRAYPDPVPAEFETGGADLLTSAPTRLVKVLCVDDSTHFRGVIADVIAATPGFVKVGEAASGEEAIAAAVSLRPDLVLMDVRMPGMGGFEAAMRLLEVDLRLLVVLMSADPIEAPALFEPPDGAVVTVSKCELARRGLLGLWQEFGRG